MKIKKTNRKGDENKIVFGSNCLYILFDNDKQKKKYIKKLFYL